MSFFNLPWVRSSLTNRNDQNPELTSPTRPAVWQPRETEQRDEHASTTSDFIHVPVMREPHTPEGLRTRPSASMIRQELGLDSREEPENHQSSDHVPPPDIRPFLVEKSSATNNNLLPPVPSSSWSIPRQTGSMDQLLYSPAVSTNGFYSKQSARENRVAESPALLPGKAKTAVGALVAKQHNKISNSSNYPPLLAAASSASTGGYEGDADGPGLPQVHSNEEWGYKSEHHLEEFTSRTAYEDEQPYYPLDKDPIQQSRTPPPKGRLKTACSPVTANSSLVEASPSSMAKRALETSLQVASASSLMGQRFLETSDHWPCTRGEEIDEADVSVSSRMGLIPSAQNKQDYGNERYDFAPVHDASFHTGNHVNEVVLANPSDQTHISAMSLSVPDGNHVNYADAPHFHQDGTDESLVSQKVKNQRCSREDLVAAAVERLQDDIDLVVQVEDAGRDVTQEMGDWFVKTDVSKEGILTGFSVDNRRKLSIKLTAIMDEIRGIARPDDFLAISPQHLPLYSETHSDLYQALHFCNTLVLMAIPLAEQQTSSMLLDAKMQGRWKIDSSLRHEMKFAATLNTPEPHRHNCGDTSVFTLPSESADTPMTSNLSVSTAHKEWPSKKRLQVESHQIQRTIELVSTLLEKLSSSCRMWLDSPATSEIGVKITRELKRYYLQLVAISHDDLCALVHAFDLEQDKMTVLPPIAQLVSADEGDILPGEDEDVVRAGGDSFSPVLSLDMESKKSFRSTHTIDEFDDLRRQIGSSDYSDHEEARDGPP